MSARVIVLLLATLGATALIVAFAEWAIPWGCPGYWPSVVLLAVCLFTIGAVRK